MFFSGQAQLGIKGGTGAGQISNLHLYAQAQAPGRGYQSIVLDTTYEHAKWGIAPADIVYHFAAYSTSFDSDDDNNEDSKSDIWGIPEWVAYEIKQDTDQISPDYSRPRWLTDDNLYSLDQAPHDNSYMVSGTRDLKEVKTDYRYVRGHLCPKATADRISMEAGYNTHTLLNAVPQLQWQNNGVWKDLESDINQWADEHKRVWVVTGPVFFGKTPAVWLGQDDEVKVAVPDALFKIVIRDANTETGLETLAFIVPNIIAKENTSYSEYLTSIARIESLTGLSFLTNLNERNRYNQNEKHADLAQSQKASMIARW